MRIKIISHNNMKASVSYLYGKLEDENTELNTSVNMPIYEKEQFFSFIDSCRIAQEERTGRKSKTNNMIKHLVVSLHPKDRELFEEKKPEIIKDILKAIGIKDPEDHGLTIFDHHDTAHPHIHLAFSRVSLGGEVFNDKNLGYRLNDLADVLDKKYGLRSNKNNKSRIHIRNKHLYKPTEKGTLLKLIDYAAKNSNNLKEFKATLLNHGIFPKINEEKGTISYVNNSSHVSFPEYKLPVGARLKNLYKTIKTNKLSQKEKEYKQELKAAIIQCKNLQEIKDLFKGSKVYFQKGETHISNIKIETESEVISLSEFMIENPKIDTTIDDEITKGNNVSAYMKIPLIFEPIIMGNDYEMRKQQREEKQASNKRKKGKQKGMKIKY